MFLLLACVPDPKDTSALDGSGTGDTSAETDTGGGNTDSEPADDTAETEDSGDTSESGESAEDNDDTDDTAETGCGTYTDADGDGFGDAERPSCDQGAVADASDCDDNEPTRYPGAPELCDAHANDCDAWAEEDEVGLVTWYPASGPPEDRTTSWTGGTSRVPLELTLGEGTWNVCPGTWYVNLVATGPLVVVGVYGQEVTELNGVADRILLAPDALTVSGLTFTFGSADEDDGGAILQLGGELSVQECTFQHNSGVWGGAIAVEHDPHDTSDVTLTGLTFLDGYAERGGGVYAEVGGWLRGTDLHFERNLATDAGGAMSVLEAANLVLQRCDFAENEAAGVGGALHADVSWPLQLSELTFSGNEAGEDGGGAWIAGPDNADLATLVFEDNTASRAGGGLAAYVDTLRVEGLTAANNAATDGGGVYVLANGAAFSGTEVADNVASGVGGGIAAQVSSAFRLEDATVATNTAETGGGLWVSGDAHGTADLTGVRLEENAASDGGGAYLGIGTATLSRVAWTDNEAAEDGAGLWSSGAVAADAEVLFTGGSATRGGGVYVGRGTYACIGDATTRAGFLQNSAVYGGAVVLGDTSGVELTAVSCDFGTGGEDNVATDTGNDVYLLESGTAYDAGDDATFTCNDATCG